MHHHDPAQYVLDFSSRLADECRRLRGVLRQLAGADLRHWSLCLLVHNHSTPASGLVRDYEELADLLWCGRSTVIRVVNLLVDADLLLLKQTFDADGRARKNEYRLNWPEIDRRSLASIAALGCRVRESRAGPVGSQSDTLPSQSDTLPSQSDTLPSRVGTSSKEEFFPGILEKDTGTGPEAEPRPRMAAGTPGNPRKGPGQDELRRVLLAELPELREAAERRLVPLPANTLVYGPLQRLKIEHLRSIPSLVEWHQRQLSCSWPVMGDTEADLLLTLAARLYALGIPTAEVRKNRVAAFCAVLGRREFRKVLPHVPEARAQLAEFAARREGDRFWIHVPREAPCPAT